MVFEDEGRAASTDAKVGSGDDAAEVLGVVAGDESGDPSTDEGRGVSLSPDPGGIVTTDLILGRVERPTCGALSIDDAGRS